MNLLETINENDFIPEDYTVRNVVRCVILNEDNSKVLLFGYHLPGGGVEVGENDADAIARQCMEDVGAKVEVVKALGEIVAYRDFLKKKYVVNGYLCKVVGELEKPKNKAFIEEGIPVHWLSIASAVHELEENIKEISQQFPESVDADVTQRKIFNRTIALRFLQEINTQ